MMADDGKFDRYFLFSNSEKLQLSDSFINACAKRKTRLQVCVCARLLLLFFVRVNVYHCICCISFTLCVLIFKCVCVCVIFYLFRIDHFCTRNMDTWACVCWAVWIHVPHFMHIIWRGPAVIIHYIIILCSVVYIVHY